MYILQDTLSTEKVVNMIKEHRDKAFNEHRSCRYIIKKVFDELMDDIIKESIFRH